MREPYSNRETRITMEPFKCSECGWASATGKAECHYCRGERDARAAFELEEEQRRGVVDTEDPTWQRQVLVLLDEALPPLYQALLKCGDKETSSALTALLRVVRNTQIDLEEYL
jgi:hypothetical protein